jgi:hypothetical protein
VEYTVTRRELTAQPVLVVRQRVTCAEIAATIGATLPKVFLHAQQRGPSHRWLPSVRSETDPIIGRSHHWLETADSVHRMIIRGVH